MSRFEISLPWQKAPQTECKPDRSGFEVDSGDEPSGDFVDGARRLASPQTFFVPVHYEANYRYPLIVWLHSNGYNENQIDHVMPHISTRNYMATGVRGTRAADAIGHRFDWHDSAAAIDVIEDIVRRETAGWVR